MPRLLRGLRGQKLPRLAGQSWVLLLIVFGTKIGGCSKKASLYLLSLGCSNGCRCTADIVYIINTRSRLCTSLLQVRILRKLHRAGCICPRSLNLWLVLDALAGKSTTLGISTHRVPSDLLFSGSSVIVTYWYKNDFNSRTLLHDAGNTSVLLGLCKLPSVRLRVVDLLAIAILQRIVGRSYKAARVTYSSQSASKSTRQVGIGILDLSAFVTDSNLFRAAGAE